MTSYAITDISESTFSYNIFFNENKSVVDNKRDNTGAITSSIDNTEAITRSIDDIEETTVLINNTNEITSHRDDTESTSPRRNGTGATTENSHDAETEVDDYDSDGFDENLDPYDLPVQNSEINTKTQCPICRSYCW